MKAATHVGTYAWSGQRPSFERPVRASARWTSGAGTIDAMDSTDTVGTLTPNASLLPERRPDSLHRPVAENFVARLPRMNIVDLPL